MQHRDVERDDNLVGNVAVEVDHGTGGQHRRRVERRPVSAKHLSGRDFRTRTPPTFELLGDVAAVHPHPRGAETVAHGKRSPAQFSGTGSRISARASGAAARNASADSSSGWACERTSASTLAR